LQGVDFIVALLRAEQVAQFARGCAYRALCCIGKVLFALNRRSLINERARWRKPRSFR
jgi:hypothetical protein